MTDRRRRPGDAGVPIACDLPAAELAARAGELLPGLVALAEERETVPGGLRWRFASATGLLERIARVIEAERTCCRFLRFRVDADPGAGPVWVEVTGPDGTAAFLETLTGPNAPASDAGAA